MSSIRLGNRVRYEDRLWTFYGRAHRSDGVWLLLVDTSDETYASVRPDEVEDLGNFSRPQAHGGSTPPAGMEPVDGNRPVAEAAEQ